MAKGAQAKQEIFNKLLEIFPNSFMQDDKILRIPMVEGHDNVEIKVTLTAAKDILGAGGGAPQSTEEFDWSSNSDSGIEAATATTLSDEEKDNIKKMIEALNL